jgi:signal transduction histidine kinase
VRVVIGEEVVVEVEDDGVGVSADAARSGLVNLATRAESSGGSFTLTPREPAGSLLTWRAPRL